MNANERGKKTSKLIILKNMMKKNNKVLNFESNLTKFI